MHILVLSIKLLYDRIFILHLLLESKKKKDKEKKTSQ